jgi:hypothetical protein
MFLPNESATLPSPETCVHFAYEAIKDGRDPALSLAWSSLARALAISVDITEMTRLLATACSYSDNPNEQNLLALRNGVSNWRNLNR